MHSLLSEASNRAVERYYLTTDGRNGIRELRVDVGQGYRVYYARHGRVIVVLLCAGDKRTQASDIDTAVTYWGDYLGRLA
jgi:putative addiction module killer protein